MDQPAFVEGSAMCMALLGAHGCGKTTLAKAVIAGTGDGGLGPEAMRLVASNASGIFRELGFPMHEPLTFDQRMILQRAVLLDHIKNVQTAGSFAISDRSTIDMAVYTLGEWGTRATGEQGEEIMRYVDECIRAANRLYSSITLVNPGIPYVATPDRPLPNRAGTEMFTMLAESMLRDYRVNPPCFTIMRMITNLDERVAIMHNIWNAVMVKALKELETIDVN